MPILSSNPENDENRSRDLINAFIISNINKRDHLTRRIHYKLLGVITLWVQPLVWLLKNKSPLVKLVHLVHLFTSCLNSYIMKQSVKTKNTFAFLREYVWPQITS